MKDKGEDFESYGNIMARTLSPIDVAPLELVGLGSSSSMESFAS